MLVLGLGCLLFAGATLAWASMRNRPTWIRAIGAAMAGSLEGGLHWALSFVGEAIVPGAGGFRSPSALKVGANNGDSAA